MSMEHKTFEVEAKAESDTGAFRAYASVFNNIDKGGDRVLPGAFRGTLRRWRQSGNPIPIIVSHKWDDLRAWIGKADPLTVFEDERGLVVHGQLDMDDPDARKVHKLMKEGLLRGWSFGYSVPKGGQRRGKDGANEISEVELFEVGPTLAGMNPEAQLVGVKSDLPAELIGTAWDPLTATGGIEPWVEAQCPETDAEFRKRLWREVRVKAREIEAEEAEQEARAKEAAAREAARIPVTDKPFVTDDGKRLRTCSAPGCAGFPTNEIGAWRPVHDRKWWCPKHEHLAGPEDHLAEVPTFIAGENPGSSRLNPESEEGKRVQVEVEREQRERHEREEAEKREAEALAKLRADYEENAEISVCGVRVKPKNVRFH